MRSLILIYLLVSSFLTVSQHRCPPHSENHPFQGTEHRNRLQEWISKRIKKVPPSIGSQQDLAEIPVVFHIIHNGEEVGEGTNISDERILQQVAILNEDFRNLNPNAVDTRSEFVSAMADSEIAFTLARQDPNGLPTNGIVRVQGSKTSYAPRVGNSDDILLKSESQWPAENYLNIYVANITSFLGYAQFPFTNLEGISKFDLGNEFINYDKTDGVVVNYEYIGINIDFGGDFDAYGRTLTHEIGHYLGLIHIWGNGCNSDDFCADTPNQSSSTFGCDLDRTTCGNLNMVQNFMDYTDDECMTLFTEDQKSRMKAVLAASPRRNSLLTSPGLDTPPSFSSDLGIVEIIEPSTFLCEGTLNPRVVIGNFGNDFNGSIEIRVFVDNELRTSETRDLTIGQYQSSEVTLAEIILTESEDHEIRFEINYSDERSENNVVAVNVPAFATLLPPYINRFDSQGLSTRVEQNKASNWSIVTAPDTTALNNAAMINFYNNTENFGLKDFFVSQTLDVSALNSAELSFQYAYAARISDSYNDGLIVAISDDCGDTFSRENYLFEEYSTQLATTSATDDMFVPDGPLDWEQVNINISRYLGAGTIQIAFIGENGGGNNLFIDDVVITSTELKAIDLGIRNITNITPATCFDQIASRLELKNFGFMPVQSFEITLIQNGIPQTESFSGINLLSGQSQTFNLNLFDLDQGFNEMTFQISEVNGETDQGIDNNTFEYSVWIDDTEESIPIRETFSLESNWLLNAESTAIAFSPGIYDGEEAIVANAFGSEIVGGKSFIISPTILTNNASQSAIRFRYSYASRTGFNDQLNVYLSPNCGRSFEIPVYNAGASELTDRNSDEAWIPTEDEDWQIGFIDITEHLVWNSLRIAFEFVNGGGNNLYISDIEVLTSNDPDLPRFDSRFTTYPNPAHGEFYVAMNLPEKENIQIRLMDMAGRTVFDQQFSNTLNQTYRFIAPSESGFYLLQVIGEQVKQVKRLYIRP